MTDLNLVTDAWVPVLDGNAVHRVTPVEVLTGNAKALGYAQPDLNAACLELLVCMAQTTVPPPDEKAWRAWMKARAFPNDLADRWLRLKSAFDVRGNGRPFMQDTSLDVSDPKPIELLDATRSPGIAVEEGRALFAQPDDSYRLSYDEAALRLWIYETWSPISISRLRGSYRGFGPLSTLVRMDTLRETVISNVLPVPNADDPLQWIGWNGVQKDEDEEPLIQHRDHQDPRSALWMTPRRVRFAFGGEAVVGFVNGSKRGELQQTAPHPHSPGHYNGKKWVAVQGRKLAGGYPELLPLMVEVGKTTETARAHVVAHYLNEWAVGLPHGGGGRLWAYGYQKNDEIGKNGVHGWNEAQAPLRLLGQEARARVDQVLSLSEKLLKKLWRACYEVAKDDEPNRSLSKHDKKLPFDNMRDRYHRATEVAFWRVVEGKPDSRHAVLSWWESGCGAAEALLKEWASTFPDTRLAGRVRAESVLRGARHQLRKLLIVEEA